MGISTELWRIRVGRFIGSKLKGRKCQASHRSTPSFILLGSISMVMTLLLLVNVGSVNHTVHQLHIRSVFILLLSKKVLHILGVSLNLMATLAVFAVICFLLAIGNIEANPGPGPYPCRFCPIVPQTISSSVRHQHDHRMDSNFTYMCPGCEFTTSSWFSMNHHVSTEHRQTKHRARCADTLDTSQQFSCAVADCSVLTPSLWEIVQHYYSHLSTKDGKVPVPIPKCPVPECNRPLSKPFKKRADLQVHMSQTHSSWLDEGCPKKKKRKLSNESGCVDPPPSCAASTFRAQDEEIDCSTESSAGPEVEPTIDPQILNDELVLDCIAKFYLKLYGEFFLPYSVIQEISEGLALLCNITHSRMNLLLTRELKNLNVEDLKINLIRYKVMCADLLYASHSKEIPGPTFTSDYLRKKYFEKNFNFKAPTEVSLDTNSEKTDKKYQYVPVRQTLESVLEDPIVQRDIDNSFLPKPPRQDGIKANYTDGQQFQSENHPQKEIHLFLFQDAFNPVMNVLGSAKNKYKDLGVYFTIGNLKSTLRSKVSSKHLVMLIRESLLKSVGSSKCFQKLKEDLADLEKNGIMYKGENIKVVVQYGIGDNLGQHFIGGYVENFSGTYCCRFCNVKRKVYKENPSVTHSLRTRQSYGQCVYRSRLTGKPYQGVKGESIFNNLKYFHAATHLAPCAAHDIHEGVINYDLAGIIQSLVKSKWFTYELLNRRIKRFRCIGADGPNKPALVNDKGKKLGGHAVQNWTLLRIFPFIIADKIVDTEHAAWKLYLNLKELCEYLCGPEFSETDMPYVKDVLLPQYFDQRSQVLSKETHPVRPKHHFLCHYPELSLKYGPLQQLWTLPYEQMHKMFKHAGRLGRNFKNLEHSLATRCQLNFCYLGTGPLFKEESTKIRPKPLSYSSHPGQVSRFLQDQNLIGGTWIECDALHLGGLYYKLNDLLLLSSSAFNHLRAGFIRLILTTGSRVEFVLEIVEPIYCQNLGIFKIPRERTGCLIKLSQESLKHPVPQPLYLFDGIMSLSLKYKLVESN